MACLPLLARAEGKCNDDPFWLDTEKTRLGVAWSIPMVEAAVNDNPSGTLLADLDGLLGAEPAGFPAEHSEKLTHYPLPEQTRQTFSDSNAVATWLSGFNIPVEAPYRSALDAYFAPQKCAAKEPGGTKTCSITGLTCDDVSNPCKRVVVYGWKVRHPPAKDKGKNYKFCTCILQRAALVFRGDREELWIRTRFRSARPASEKVAAATAHFSPSTPVVFTFESKRIWFPLAFNKLPSEPDKKPWLLLDVLTQKQLDPAKVKAALGDKFTVKAEDQPFPYDGADWWVIRISRSYAPGDPASDLLIEGP
jgi:hypothetical protein